MTHALGTTLQDIEAKAERKRTCLSILDWIKKHSIVGRQIPSDLETIRKYIEEN